MIERALYSAIPPGTNLRMNLKQYDSTVIHQIMRVNRHGKNSTSSRYSPTNILNHYNSIEAPPGSYIDLIMASSSSELSANSHNRSTFSLSKIPGEIHVGIAGFLDHKSLVHLSTTSSAFQAVGRDTTLWMRLHHTRWPNGKLAWFEGLPSQRPRNGTTYVDEEARVCSPSYT